MSRKSQFTVEQKINASIQYLSGKKSAALLAKELNMGKRGVNSIYKWSKKYKAYGADVFINKPRNNCYSREFKMKIVKEYLDRIASPNDLVLKYNIPSTSTLMRWITMYNNHIELKDYYPKPEVYMADTLKTTYEERLEIARYCIIKSTYRRSSKYNYKKSTPEETADNILKRDFNSKNPNEKWCTDVTEIKVPKTGEKLYISPILDLYDRYPISYAVSGKNDTALVNKALKIAHNAYPNATPIYHSDRGFQYTKTAFKDTISEYGMTQSMSRVSRCIDNGPVKGFKVFLKICCLFYTQTFNLRKK